MTMTNSALAITNLEHLLTRIWTHGFLYNTLYSLVQRDMNSVYSVNFELAKFFHPLHFVSTNILIKFQLYISLRILLIPSELRDNP